jgi:hypothetical protein
MNTRHQRYVVTLAVGGSRRMAPAKVAAALATLIEWVRTVDVEGCELLTLDSVEVVGVEPVSAPAVPEDAAAVTAPRESRLLSAAERRRVINEAVERFVDLAVNCPLGPQETWLARLAKRGFEGYARMSDRRLIAAAKCARIAVNLR